MFSSVAVLFFFLFSFSLGEKREDGVFINLISLHGLFAGHLDKFHEKTGITVNVEYHRDRASFFSRVMSDLLDGSPEFDGYIGSPQWMSDFVDCDACPGPVSSGVTVTNSSCYSSAATTSSIEPLGDLIRQTPEIEWSDVVPFWRKFNAAWGGEIFSIPLDGDLHFLHYRADVLDKHGIPQIKTWDDAVFAAESLAALPSFEKDWNGDGIEDYVTCLSNQKGSEMWIFIWTIASSLIQRNGTQQSLFFDTETFEPKLSSEGFAKALQVLKALQAENPKRLFDLLTARDWLINGTCAITIDWSDIPILIQDRLSPYRDYILTVSPGSEVVDVDGVLTPCTEELCPFGQDDSSGRRLNFAPYSAGSGWSGMVSSQIPPERIKATFDYFAFLCSPSVSSQDILNGTTGMQPYRFSHLEEELWESAGYLSEATKQFLNQTATVISSPNLVLDLRMKHGNEYLTSLDPLLFRYFEGQLTEEGVVEEGLKLWNTITEKVGFEEQINNYRISLNLPVLDFRVEVDIVSDGAWIAILTIGTLSIVIELLFGTLLIVFRKSTHIAVSSPKYMLGMLLGCVMINIAVIVWTSYPSDPKCLTSMIVGLLGAALMITNLLVRSVRVLIIYRNAQNYKITRMTDSQMLPLVLIPVLLMVVLIITWAVIDPPRKTRTTSSLSDSEFAYICNSPDDGLWFFVSLVLFVAVFLLAGCFLVYQTRGTAQAFNESRFLAISLYQMTIALAIIVVLVLSLEDITLIILLTAFAILVSILVTVFAIFLPKFWFLARGVEPSIFTESQKSIQKELDLDLRDLPRPLLGTHSIVVNDCLVKLRFTDK